LRHFELQCAPVGDEEENGKWVGNERRSSWKMRYKLSTEWRWETSPTGKAPPLNVSNRSRTVGRPSQDGINPIVRTSKPFTRARNYIEIVVEEVGSWFRCGVADPAVLLDDGNLLGGQNHSFNIGYCKSGSIYSCYSGKMEKKLPAIEIRKRVVSGCRLGIQWDQDQRTFFFYFDGVLVESVSFLFPETATSNLFPTVQLSYCSQVSINPKSYHRSVPQVFDSGAMDVSGEIVL